MKFDSSGVYEMKIAFINGSPKAKDSASACLIEDLKGILALEDNPISDFHFENQILNAEDTEHLSDRAAGEDIFVTVDFPRALYKLAGEMGRRSSIKANGLKRKDLFLQKQLFSDDLDKDFLVPLAVEFSVEDLLPGPEIEFAVRDGTDHFTPHYGPFQMGVGVVFKTVVLVLAVWFFRRKALQKPFEVPVQAAFIIVYEHACRYMHSVYEDQALPDAAFPESGFHLGRDVDECPSCRRIDNQHFPVRFH
jgi:hypothetical protein